METKNKGITLIALIITIIVLLILAGITIATLTGNHGILTQVDNAKASTIKSKVEEEIGLAVQSANLKIRTKKAQDNSWNATTDENKGIIKGILEEDLKDGYTVTPEELNTETGIRKIRVVYEGSDYKKATKNNNAKITKTLDVSPNKIIYGDCNHIWVDGEVITEATCTTAGSKKQTCTNCGETKTEEIPAEHTWNAGVETTPATCTEAGVKTYTCTVTGCGETKTEEIPALGHNFGADGRCTRCSVTFSGNLKELYPEITWAILEDIAKQVSQDASIRAETTEVADDIVTSVTKTVGDKTYTISLGNWMPVDYTDGSTTITKKARIIGFKHDVLASGTAYGGTADTYAGISFEFVNTLEPDSGMNSTGDNLKGWEGCELRKKLLPTNMKVKSTENTYGTGDYYTKLPTALTDEIKTVKKKWNPGNQDTAGLIQDTEDKLWLLSYTEVWGGKLSNCDPEGVRYGNYTKGASRIKYSGASTSTSYSSWWLRSPDYGTSYFFYYINFGGNFTTYYASNSSGVAPGFSI